MNGDPSHVQVALPIPITEPLTYLWPESIPFPPAVGLRVLVPLGKRRVTGYVVHAGPGSPASAAAPPRSYAFKPIHSVLDEEPLFGPRELQFYQWIAQYYLVSVGEVLRTALPGSMNVRTYRAVRILPQGMLALEQGLFLTRQETDLLAQLRRGGRMTLQGLRQKVGRPVDRDLNSLENKGFVERCQVLKGKKAGGTIEKDFPVSTPSDSPPSLTVEQETAVNTIRPLLMEKGFHSFLLHGVTSSGKTEIYLRVIEQALKLGRDALVLVPEIALTPQTLQRFSSRFGTQVAVLHSGLTDRERLDFWWKIRRGRARIAMGARSAVFAPFRNLGVIVVDEEHDPSYKQQDRVRYNARDLALVRGQREKAVVILGSATPSLESYYNAQKGKSTLLELTERMRKRPQPEVVPIDMRQRSSHGKTRSSLSLPLQEALIRNWNEGKKSLVFLNRRGYAHTMLCRDCGHLVRCPHCSVSLTFHRAKGRLCCHYCEYQTSPPSRCPSCRGADIQPVGRGTEKIEEEIGTLLPQARIGRMDRDTTQKKGAHEKILSRFRGEDLDILIGTQMVTKGHDIPEVTLVGVILADVSLDLPDFRASERTLQLLMQVAGRAGRGEWPGQVLIQSYHPDHYCIESVVRHDFKGFYDQEIAARKELDYPPFSRMVNLRITGRNEAAVQRAARRMAQIAHNIQKRNIRAYREIEILGPSTAPLARLRDRFRFHCFLKGNTSRTLLGFTREILSRRKEFLPSSRLLLEVDVDPIQVL